MKWRETIRQAYPGLNGLAALSALIVPLWIWISAYHAEHWFGGQRTDLWAVFVRPWSGRIWSGLMVLAIIPWAARKAHTPSPMGNMVLASGIDAVLGTFVCCVMAIPAWVWLAQIGSVNSQDLIITGVLASIPLASSILVVRGIRHYVPLAISQLAGVIVGGVCLWIVWEPMA